VDDKATRPRPRVVEAAPLHAVLACVFQVRGGTLQVLLWQRARDPQRGRWALPGGRLDRREPLEQTIRRHLATKVDVRELSWLEQLATLGDPDRDPRHWELATAYLGLVPSNVDPRLPADTRWHPVAALPPTAFDHGTVIDLARERLRAKLSYTNLGFALAPAEFTIAELAAHYSAALGYRVSQTNLRRVLERRGAIVPTGELRRPGRGGGRPASVWRFASRELAVTDPFAVLRPPQRPSRRADGYRRSSTTVDR